MNLSLGYGHIYPLTNEGRVFCIVYGLFGIPLMMLFLASLGKHVQEGLQQATDKVIHYFNNLFHKKGKEDKGQSARYNFMRQLD